MTTSITEADTINRTTMIAMSRIAQAMSHLSITAEMSPMQAIAILNCATMELALSLGGTDARQICQMNLETVFDSVDHEESDVTAAIDAMERHFGLQITPVAGTA